MVDRQHRHRESRLQRSVLEEVVNNHLRIGVAFEFDDYPRFLRGFVANSADVGQSLLID